MLTAKASPSTRVTACTPGTFNRLGTCSVSYTSLNSDSSSRSTSMLATNRYLDLIGIGSAIRVGLLGSWRPHLLLRRLFTFDPERTKGLVGSSKAANR